MPYPRPPPEHPGHWADLFVMPEIQGWKIRRLSLAQKTVRVWCRACGRDAIITPLGLATIFRKHMDRTIDEVAPRMVCDTCGAREAQVSMWVVERPDGRLSIIRREHAGVALRREG